MKRELVVLLLFVAMHVHAADKWFDHYKKCVAAVNGRSYRLGADLLQKSIAEMPNEGTGVRDVSILFQPFRENADGSGLGLYISRTLVRTFGGDLRFVPTETGSRFDVILPCEPGGAAAA